MIRLEDLEEAILECQGERNPNAQTCIKLAAYYTIKEHLFSKKEETPNQTNVSTIDSVNIDTFTNRNPQYSYAYKSDTEFANLARRMEPDELVEVMDELMSVLEATNPRLYRGVINKMLDI